LRQAYDYWQNQPGNYRSPGLACRRPRAPERLSKLLVVALADAPRGGSLGVALVAAGGNLLSPSQFPRAPSAAQVQLGCPKRRALPSLPQPWRRWVIRDFPLLLSFSASHRPDIHRAHPPPVQRLTPDQLQASPVRRTARGQLSRGRNAL
jgi:hypothetical protein